MGEKKSFTEQYWTFFNSFFKNQYTRLWVAYNLKEEPRHKMLEVNTKMFVLILFVMNNRLPQVNRQKIKHKIKKTYWQLSRNLRWKASFSPIHQLKGCVFGCGVNLGSKGKQGGIQKKVPVVLLIIDQLSQGSKCRRRKVHKK